MMARMLALMAALVTFLVAEARCCGFPAPSFGLETCAWEATHIILVKAGEKIDGNFEVVESWKGGLRKGDHVLIPELAEFAPEEERIIKPRLFQKTIDGPTHVTCSRMVLFLIRKEL